MASLPQRLWVNRLRFTWMYLRRRTPWDTGISPPELVEAVEGPAADAPGRALDLGCGTGTNSLYLAQHGWQVVGIDFAAPAIARAQAKLRRTDNLSASVRFLRGDVTVLEALRLGEPFTLLFDLGCFHGLPVERRGAYAAGLAGHAARGALFLLYAFDSIEDARPRGISAEEVRSLFGPAFTVEREVRGTDRRARASAWYWLRRT